MTQWLAAKPTKRKYFPLLDLPAELRMEVYKNLLPNLSIPAVRRCNWNSDPGHLLLRSDGNSCCPQILRTCRLVYEEASSLIYDVLEFRIKVDSHGIWFRRGQTLQGWKEFTSSIHGLSDAKKYLGERWTFFTRAKKLYCHVFGDLPWDWDHHFRVMRQDYEDLEEDTIDEISAGYEVKANLQLLADVLRITGGWRKQQGLSAPKISITTVIAVDVDYHHWEHGKSRWLLEPLSDARGCEVVKMSLDEDCCCDCGGYGSEGVDEGPNWEDDLKVAMAGDPAFFSPDAEKQRMQDQLNGSMEFMKHVGFEHEVEPLWHTLHLARTAFDKRDKKLFVEKIQSLVRRWKEILKVERRRHRKAAPGLAAVVQSLKESESEVISEAHGEIPRTDIPKRQNATL